MAITRPFRATPQLGPSITSWDTHYWYDLADIDVSYRLGNKEWGTDGREYVMVQLDPAAAAAVAAGGRVNITEGTWIAVANASGTHQVSPDIRGGSVPAGAYFQARKFTL